MGLPEVIKINVGSWSHVQKLDYEQLPFKCRKCHVYGHFSRGCPSNVEAKKGKEEGCNQAKRSKTSHKAQNLGGPNGKGPLQATNQKPPPKRGQENKFDPLIQQIEESQEVEIQKPVYLNKGIPAYSLKGASAAESSKGNPLEVEEEDQELEYSEEDGEIGESQASVRRSRRGRKTDREKSEQETYKEKL